MKAKLFVVRLALAALFAIPCASAGEIGKLSRELWKDIEGSGTWHLKNHPRFHDKADISELIDGVEPPADFGENYGQRLRGYINIPESGEYRFWIAGDDNCELWLGEGESKFETRKIAWIVGLGWGHGRDWSGVREWGKIPTQQSGPIVLEAGKRYFIEVLHKQGQGADHLSVGWTRPGGKRIEVVPPEVLESYSGDPGDLDGDGLPDSWQERHLAGAPLEDPDGDGLSNSEEYRLGTDPKSGSGRKGHLSRDIWYGIWGREVANLLEDPRFYARPDRRDTVAGATTSTDYGDQCGVRLRGYLLPEVSGDYEFWIAGDDNCELWLSDGESKFSRTRIAEIHGGAGFVRPGEWDKMESQRSAPVRLEAGKRYFFEVLLKEGWWEDFVSIAWRAPGGEREVVPAANLVSYVPTAEDSDDDGMPTEWELHFGLDPFDSDGVHGALGDPDDDLIPNFLEYLSGTSPVEANGFQGGVAVEIWRDLAGVRVVDLVRSDGFLGYPSWVQLHLAGLEFGGNGERYGMRARTLVTAPATGNYTFWIAGDDNCELWLSTSDSKFLKRKVAWVKGPGSGDTGDWVDPGAFDWQASQRSQSVRLEEGQAYYLEILHKQGVGADHVAVAWQGPGMKERVVVPAEALVSWFPDPEDLDDDFLPDSWESFHGLDPENNGSKDPGKEGEYGDYDGDGLTNREEYLLGTDPRSADSDGDGVGDFDEVRVYGTNPAVKDASPPVVVASLPLMGYNAGSSRWIDTGVGKPGTIHSLERRGETTWEFEVAAAGIYQVDLRGYSTGVYLPVAGVPVSVRVNGVIVGRGDLEPGPPSTRLAFMTQWLEAGAHQVSVFNHNARVDVSLAIESLELLAQTGEDLNGNGLPDWLEKFYTERNRTFDHSSGFATSPACLEGQVRFFEDLSIAMSGEAVAAERSTEGRWFANIPLDPSGAPVSLALSFEGGAILEDCSPVWVETNLFDIRDAMVVRLGDAMRLTAYLTAKGATGTRFRIESDSAIVHEGPADEPHVFLFDREGPVEMSVTATLGDGTELTAKVRFEVVSGRLGGNFHVPSNLSRTWTPEFLPAAAVLEADDNLSLLELPGVPRAFNAGFNVTREASARVVARLPGGGPVLDAATIHGFFLAASTWTGSHHVVQTLPDGTRVVRVGYVIDGEIPPDLSIWIQMQVPDAVFANGDVWLRLTAADFDENGQAYLEIYKAPGDDIPYVCHWLRPFSGGPDEPEPSESR